MNLMFGILILEKLQKLKNWKKEIPPGPIVFFIGESLKWLP
jgi:hypothetical protein